MYVSVMLLNPVCAVYALAYIIYLDERAKILSSIIFKGGKTIFGVDRY